MSNRFYQSFSQAAKPRLFRIHRGFTKPFSPKEMAWMFSRIDHALARLTSLPEFGTHRSKLWCLGHKLRIIWEVDNERKYPRNRPWHTSALWALDHNVVGLTVTYSSALAKDWAKYKLVFRTAIGAVLAHEYAHTFQTRNYLMRGLKRIYRVTNKSIVLRIRGNTSYRIVPSEFFADAFAFSYYLWRHPQTNVVQAIRNVLTEMTDGVDGNQILQNARYKQKLSLYWKVA